MKDDWKSTTMTAGEQFVTITSTIVMRRLPVSSWDLGMIDTMTSVRFCDVSVAVDCHMIEMSLQTLVCSDIRQTFLLGTMFRL